MRIYWRLFWYPRDSFLFVWLAATSSATFSSSSGRRIQFRLGKTGHDLVDISPDNHSEGFFQDLNGLGCRQGESIEVYFESF